jgi:hypothetical protein
MDIRKNISKVGAVLKRICSVVGHTKMDIHESVARIDSDIDSLLRIIRSQAVEITKLTNQNGLLGNLLDAKTMEVDALVEAKNEDAQMWKDEWWKEKQLRKMWKASMYKRSKENEVLKNRVRQLKRGPTRRSKRLKAKTVKRLRTK